MHHPKSDHTGARAHLRALRTLAAVATVAAILTAVTHVAIIETRLHLLGRLVATWAEFVWMAPLAYTGWFLLLGSPLVLVAVVAPDRMFPVATGFFTGLGVFNLLLLFREVHPLAFLVFAGGVGLRVALWAPKHSDAIRKVAVPLAAVGTAVLATVGVVRTVQPVLAEIRALSSERSAAPGAPNVLLLILDTVRALNVGVYGYTRPTTPFIDELAREGVVFEHAFSTEPWTLPSHASILTGRWAAETGASYLTPLDPTLPTLPRVLRANGYVTAGFSANSGWAGREVGIGRDFQRYVTHRLDWRQLLWSTSLTQTQFAQQLVGGIISGDWSRVARALRTFELRTIDPRRPPIMRADEVAARFREWRARIGDRHPYFAMLNFFDAHSPYVSPPAFRSRFNGGERAIDKYDGAIAFIDSIIGTITADLHERRELGQTIVIVTSDHGEMFGEHGLQEHGKWLYTTVLHVPLIIRYPPRLGGPVRPNEAVSLRDLAATILDLSAIPDDGGLAGESLFDPRRESTPAFLLLRAARSINSPPSLPSSKGDLVGVLTDQWHYIRYPDGSEDLFDWRRDVGEVTDLSEVAWARPIVADLRSRLAAAQPLQPPK